MLTVAPRQSTLQPVRTPFDLRVNRDLSNIVPAAAGASGSATAHHPAGKTIRPADAEVSGRLQPHNKLYIQGSQWMDTTGVPVHRPCTVAYRFEPNS